MIRFGESIKPCWDCEVFSHRFVAVFFNDFLNFPKLHKLTMRIMRIVCQEKFKLKIVEMIDLMR